MTWQSSIDVKDRIFGTLVYLLALFSALPFGGFLFRQFPALQVIELPLLPVFAIYSFLGPFAGLIIFAALYFGVVRNERVGHFIRFNTLQSILIGIALSIFGLIWSILNPLLASSLLLRETLANVVFLSVLAATGFGIFQAAQGKYPQLPVFTEAVEAQVR
ncbi:MAG: hypothetical protein HC910_14785 [Spirulinaceae cyanobacterium SM2_1_0]|nr:hypothetical protein [Spirulinaceae cyanobacterium SM2_1_0]